MNGLPALVATILLVSVAVPGPGAGVAGPVLRGTVHPMVPGEDSAIANFSAAMQRLVGLVAAGAGAILALVWARVALSWFSNDVTKKVQAKDRARDALVGSLILVAALSGLVWALAQWVLTGQ
jgi:hypothetical protein